MQFRQNPVSGIGDKTGWTKSLSGNLLLGMGIVKHKGDSIKGVGVRHDYGLISPLVNRGLVKDGSP